MPICQGGITKTENAQKYKHRINRQNIRQQFRNHRTVIRSGATQQYNPTIPVKHGGTATASSEHRETDVTPNTTAEIATKIRSVSSGHQCKCKQLDRRHSQGRNCSTADNDRAQWSCVRGGKYHVYYQNSTKSHETTWQ
jgi:hypothetical protein